MTYFHIRMSSSRTRWFGLCTRQSKNLGRNCFVDSRNAASRVEISLQLSFRKLSGGHR